MSQVCYGRLVPPGPKPTHSRGEFVEEAIRLADELGIAAVTVRALGSRMNASSTAIYRYFPDKDALLAAMRERLLEMALASVPSIEDPRERIESSALAYRRTARAHPCLSQLMVLSSLSEERTYLAPQLLTEAMRQLGIQGELLVRGYRQLESLVIGASLFDFADAPRHLEERFSRLRAAEIAEFNTSFAGPTDIERINESAFHASVVTILDSLVAQAKAESLAD